MTNFLFDIYIYFNNRENYKYISVLEENYCFNFIQYKTDRIKKGFIVIENDENVDIEYIKEMLDNNFTLLIHKNSTLIEKFKDYNIEYFMNIDEAIKKIKKSLDLVKQIENIEFDIESLEKDIKNKFLFIKRDYIQRKDLEADIKNRIIRKENISILSINGYGGIGKTYLMGKIINDLTPKFMFFVFNILNESSLKEVLFETIFKYIKKINNIENVDKAELINKYKEVIIKYLNLNYSNIKKTIYIVIDSAERNKRVSYDLLELFKDYPIILTSREILDNKHSKIQLAGMTEYEAKELLKNLNEKLYNKLEQNKKIDDILKKVDYIPLAINLLAGFKKVEDIDKVLQNINIDSSMRTIVRDIFEFNYKMLNEKSKKALHAIAIISNIDTKSIQKIVKEIFSIKIPEEKLNKIINELSDIKFLKNNNSLYYIHPLLREYLMDILSKEKLTDKVNIQYKVLEILLNFYENQEEKEKFILEHLDEIEYIVKNVYIGNAKNIIYKIDNILYKNGYMFLLSRFYEKIKDYAQLADIQVRIHQLDEGIDNLYKILKEKEYYNKEFYIYLFFNNTKDRLNINLLQEILRYIPYKLNKFYHNEDKLYFIIYYSLFKAILDVLGINSDTYIQSELLLETYDDNIDANFFLSVYGVLLSNIYKLDIDKIYNFVDDLMNEFDAKIINIYFYELQAICKILSNKNIDDLLKKIKELESKRGKYTISKYVKDLYAFKKGNIQDICINRIEAYPMFYKVVLALQGNLKDSNKLTNPYEKLLVKSIQNKNKYYIQEIGYIEKVLLDVYAKDWEDKENEYLKKLNNERKQLLNDFNITPYEVEYPFEKKYINFENKEYKKNKLIKKLKNDLGVSIKFYSYHMILDNSNECIKLDVNNIELQALVKSYQDKIDDKINIIANSNTFKYAEEKEILLEYLQETKNEKIIEKLKEETKEVKYNEFEKSIFLSKYLQNDYLTEDNGIWYIKYKDLFKGKDIETYEMDLIERCYNEFTQNKI